MLKRIRVTLAIICFTLITLLFLDFTGTIHAWFGWMAKLQFIPALLASSTITVLAIIIVTLTFGRIYCSVLCPLGVYQDGMARIAEKRRKNRYKFKASRKWLRYAITLVFAVLLFVGLNSCLDDRILCSDSEESRRTFVYYNIIKSVTGNTEILTCIGDKIIYRFACIFFIFHDW